MDVGRLMEAALASILFMFLMVSMGFLLYLYIQALTAWPVPTLLALVTFVVSTTFFWRHNGWSK